MGWVGRPVRRRRRRGPRKSNAAGAMYARTHWLPRVTIPLIASAQPATQSISRSVSQSASQLVSQSVSQSVCLSVGQSVSLSVS